MAWRLIEFDALAPRQLAAWLEIRAANPALDSPYFHPAFAEAVHAVHGDVAVAVEDDTEALLPLQRTGRLALPAGWPAADFHGPVAPADRPTDPLALLRDTGLRALLFDHLPAQRAEFAPWVEARRPSPYVDVTGGLDGYLRRASRAGRDKMSEARRLTNRAAREHGPVRLVAGTADGADPELLDRVIELKRAQYSATGARDFFAAPGRRELLHRLLATRTDGFEGTMCAVYAGQTLLAAHFGLRSGSVLHWWFPVFDRAFAPLSPGWILLREVIAAAPALGLSRIDLGRGEDDYKRRAMTGSTTVCEGVATPAMLRRRMRLARRAATARLKASPLGPPLRAVVHQWRRSRR